MGKHVSKIFINLLFAICSAATLIDGPAMGQIPDLSRYDAQMQGSIRFACTASRFEGPAGYAACLSRQIASLSKSSPIPDLSRYDPEIRGTIRSACAASYFEGPAAYAACLNRQIASLSMAPAIPDLSHYDPKMQESFRTKCAASYFEGPDAFAACLNRQIASLSKSPPIPDLSRYDRQIQDRIQNACAVSYFEGPAAYAECLNKQIQSIGGPAASGETGPPGVTSKPPPIRPKGSSQVPPGLGGPSAQPAVPGTAAPPKVAAVPTPKFAWPAWNGGAHVSLPPIGGEEFTPTQIFSHASPSVYAVIAAKTTDQLKTGTDVSVGSAVAISKELALTNCHVVKEHPVIVVVQGDRIHAARLDAAHPASDRCILRVVDMSLQPAPGARPYSDLVVGESVYTIGPPSGLEPTLGEGIISGLHVNDGLRLIQTTAQISPGSSGGGLFDSHGNLVGITTLLFMEGESLNLAIAASEFWSPQ